MAKINKVNPNYNGIKYEDILNCKNISDDKVLKEFEKLKKLKCDGNKNSFCGNPIIYNYVFENMLNTRRDTKKYKTLKEIFDNEEDKKKLIDSAIRANRRSKLDYLDPVDLYELHRNYYGSINTFKPCSVKYLIDKYSATKVLDWTAGWGGRLLGSRASNCDYIGIDTNIDLKDGYDKMINKFGGYMIWESCLDVDFSTIDYDFVLTSPPYINLEMYENMTLFDNKETYYKKFLIPMIKKSLKHIQNNGYVCINISDYMYDDYEEYGGIPAIDKIDLQQQMGGKANKEIIYVFRNDDTSDEYSSIEWEDTTDDDTDSISSNKSYKLPPQISNENEISDLQSILNSQITIHDLYIQNEQLKNEMNDLKKIVYEQQEFINKLKNL